MTGEASTPSTSNPISPTVHQSSPKSSSSSSSSNRCQKCSLLHLPHLPTEWIYCSLCSSSWHWSCVALNQLVPIDMIAKWFCSNCVEKDPNLVPIFKEPPRKSTRSKPKKVIRSSNSSNDSLRDSNRYIDIANSKKNIIDAFSVPSNGPHKPFRRMKASDLNLNWLLNDSLAMTEPVLIEDKESLERLGMKMPTKDITISKIAELVGPGTPVEVIDVASQSELSRWTLDQWSRYFEKPKRDRIRNVISLEISETPLGALIQYPNLVSQMDWVHTVWPEHLRRKGSGTYPKVQKYCLMSVAGCWTDWHIDFAGSSVFYHILRGAKTFYFIRPTIANLAKYEKWSGSSKLQESTWLGDQVNVVYKVSLTAGQTMMIPTGWIHAVHTPIDSLVFGGNFLQSLNIPIQLRIHQIENNTKVPKKFRFPFFIQMLWFVVNHYLKRLELIYPDDRRRHNPDLISSSSNLAINLDSSPIIPNRILSGLKNLSDFLLTRTDEPSNDTHPALSASDLSSYLENHLNHDRIPNLRLTILRFQELLKSAPSNSTLIIHPSVADSLDSCLIKDSSSIDETADRIIKPEEHSTKAFKSPLQIKIKRKLTKSLNDQSKDEKDSIQSNFKTDSERTKKSSKIKTVKDLKDKQEAEEHQGGIEEVDKINDEPITKNDDDKTTNRQKLKLKNKLSSIDLSPQPKFKVAQQIQSLKKSTYNNKQQGGRDSHNMNHSQGQNHNNSMIKGKILKISNPSPINQIEIQRRKRPKFDDELQDQEDEINKDEKGIPKKRIKNSTTDIKKTINDHQNLSSLSTLKFPSKQKEEENDLKTQVNCQHNGHDDDQGEEEEEVEVRITRAENSVLRKWIDEKNNKVIYETRTVKTFIEKVYFSST